MRRFLNTTELFMSIFQTNIEVLFVEYIYQQARTLQLPWTQLKDPSMVNGQKDSVFDSKESLSSFLDVRSPPVHPPSPIPSYRHHINLYPWPGHLQHGIMQQCMDFLYMMAADVFYMTSILSMMLSVRLLEMLKRQVLPSVAPRPDEYLKSFTITSICGEWVASPSVLGHPLRSLRQDCSLQKLLPGSFQSPSLPKGEFPVTQAFLRDKGISILAKMQTQQESPGQKVNTIIFNRYVI